MADTTVEEAVGHGNVRYLANVAGIQHIDPIAEFPLVLTELVAKQLPDSAESRGMTIDEVVQDVMLGPTRVKAMMEPYEVGNLFAWGFSKHCKHLNGGDIHHEGGMSLTYE